MHRMVLYHTSMPPLWWCLVASLLLGPQVAAGEDPDSGYPCQGTCVNQWEECQTGVLSHTACNGNQYCCGREAHDVPKSLTRNATNMHIIIHNSKIKGRCRPHRKCEHRGGHCQTINEVCNGKIIKKGCMGRGCKCCVSMHHPTPLCKEKKQRKCSRMGGKCQTWMQECDGAIRRGSCKGHFCVCCIPRHTTLPSSTAMVSISSASSSLATSPINPTGSTPSFFSSSENTPTTASTTSPTATSSTTTTTRAPTSTTPGIAAPP